ncbi:Uncharacterised protein [Bordetella pertussis]|nr:Uncharacterised protein [Bordetella pertussis]
MTASRGTQYWLQRQASNSGCCVARRHTSLSRPTRRNRNQICFCPL